MPGSANADGSLTINTELDNTGFEKGSDKLLNAVKDLTSAVDNLGDNMMRSFQTIVPLLQTISGTVTQIYGAVNAAGQQAAATNEKVVATEQQIADTANQTAEAVRQQTGATNGLASAGQQAAGVNEKVTQTEQVVTEATKTAAAGMVQQGTAAADMSAKVDAATQSASQDFQQAGQQAQQYGSDISEAVKSSEFDKEINAAGRSCSTLSTQLQRIADSARVGLNTDAQVVRFQMAIEKARDSIVQMQSQLASLASQRVSTAEYEELAAATKKAEQALFNLYERRDIMQQMGVKENSKEWQRLAILIENAEYKLNSYERTMAGMQTNGTAFKSGADTAQYQKTAADLAQMSERLKEYEAMAAKFDTVSAPAEQSEQSLKDVDAELKKKPGDTQRASSGFQKFGSVLKTIASTALRTAGTLAKLSLKAVASGAKAVGNGFKNAAKGIKSFITRTKSASASSKGLVKQLTSLKTMLLSKIKAAIISSIWNGAKESLQELAKFSDEFDASMSNIKNSAKELSANLGVSLGELIKAVEPMLTQLLDMLSRAITYINAFFAMMQGKTTMTVAKKQTESYADSLDDAADSAEELKNQVYGFDELNKRSDNKSDDSGTGDLFEEVPVDSMLPDEIKSYFQSIKDAVGLENWNSVGEMIAEGLSSATQTVDNWINSVLRPAGVKWSGVIAEVLNGLVSGYDWTLLGKTIGDGINTIADTVNTFLTSFSFDSLGVGIGETINGLFDSIEWDLLGQTFANKWNALIDFIYGIVTTVDWSGAGDSLAEFVQNFSDTLDLDKAAETFKAGLSGITEAIVAFADSDAIKNLANLIADLIVGWTESIAENSGDVIEAIGKMVTDLLDVISEHFPDFMAAAVEVVSNLCKGISDNLPEITESAFDIITELTNGLLKLLPDILDTALELLLAVCKGISDNLSEITETAVDIILTLVEGLLDKLPDILQAALDIIVALGEGLIKSLPDLIKRLPEIITAIVKFVLNATPQIIEAGFKLLISLIENLPKIIIEIVKAVPEIITGIVNEFQKFNQKIIDIGTNLLKGIWDGISGAASWLWEKVSGWASGLIDDVKGFFGIHSPSKVFAKIGEYLMMGMADGIVDEQKNVLSTVSNIAQSMADEVGSTEATLSVDAVGGEVVTQLSSITQKLSGIATAFMTISTMLSEIGAINIPVIATGAEVPYKTRISAAEETSGDNGLSENLSDQNELISDQTYLLKQILSLIQKLKLNIDGDSLMQALASAQRNAARNYGGV